jgi:hypothetical protein
MRDPDRAGRGGRLNDLSGLVRACASAFKAKAQSNGLVFFACLTSVGSSADVQYSPEAVLFLPCEVKADDETEPFRSSWQDIVKGRGRRLPGFFKDRVTGLHSIYGNGNA